jgi:fructan beta-fructosidase
VKVSYDVTSQTLACLGHRAALVPLAGKISLHLFVDRRSVDIFGGDGRVYLPMASAIPPNNRTVSVSASGGSARIETLTVHELKSAW